MRAVPVVVPRRARLLGRVQRAIGRLVPGEEVPRTDEFLVAGRGVEVAAFLALSLPPRRDGPEPGVVVARPLRPHARVQHPDNDVASCVQLWEQRVRAVQAQELGRPGGVQLVPHLRVDQQDAWLRRQRLRLPMRQSRRVPVHQCVVGVHHGGRLRYRLQRRRVPLAVLHVVVRHGRP
jgi:hypothetical protein